VFLYVGGIWTRRKNERKMKCRSVLHLAAFFVCGMGGKFKIHALTCLLRPIMSLFLSDNSWFVRLVGWFIVLTYCTQPTADDVADNRTGTCIGALGFQAARTPVEDVTTRMLTDVNRLADDRRDYTTLAPWTVLYLVQDATVTVRWVPALCSIHIM